MANAAFTIPNTIEAASSDQARIYRSDLDILAGAGYARHLTGVQSGCGVTQQGTPNMTVAVAAGQARVGGRLVTVAAGNVTITAANATNPRIDLITVDNTGTKAVITGTAAAAPIQPDTAGRAVLAQVYVLANATSITTVRITDRRVLIVDPGYEDVTWYGAVGDNSTNNVTAFNAVMAAIPTLTPRIFRLIVVPTGIYRFASALTIPSTGVFGCRWHGLTGRTTSLAGGGFGDGGVIFRLTAGFRLFDFNAGAFGAVNVNQGPTFENIGFDGQRIASTEGIRIRMCNRATFRDCTFAGFTIQAIQFDAASDTVSGGDSSWHNIFNCSFYRNTLAIYGRLTFGINIFGGDFIAYDVNNVGIKLDNFTNIPSQHVHLYGVMFDGGNPAVDINGAAFTMLYGCKFEVCVIGVRITLVGSNAVAGKKNKVDGCAFGSGTTAVSIGVNAIENTVSDNHYQGMTNLVVIGDTPTAKQTHVWNPPLWPPGNMPLETQRSSVPVNADMINEQLVLYGVFTAGAAHLRMKIKDAAGTVTDVQVV